MSTRPFRTRSEQFGGRILTALAAGLLGLAAGGCPFSPREAPIPCTPGIDAGCKTPPAIESPTDPIKAMDNISKSLRKRGFDGPNLVPYYQDALAEEFLYLPDADAEAAAAGKSCNGQPFFANWDRTREVHFMQQILEPAQGYPDTVELKYLSRVESDPFPETDKTRYNVEYVLSLVFKATEMTERRVECYGATALWDFNGGDRSDWRLLRWEDTSPLQNVSCPGGTYGNTLGRLKALVGQCE
jgi:hypothetical protein